MTMLGHRKYQYLFYRENHGKIICPHECPLTTKSLVTEDTAHVTLKSENKTVCPESPTTAFHLADNAVTGKSTGKIRPLSLSVHGDTVL